MEFILASILTSPISPPIKPPFLLRFGIPALLILCVGIGVATLVVLIKRNIQEKRDKEAAKSNDEDLMEEATQDNSESIDKNENE